MTDFAKVITPARTVEIPLTVGNFGTPYADLHNIAPASGYEVWLAYNHDNFNNPLQQADEALYNEMGWWAEIFHDTVTGRNPSKGEVTYGRTPLLYVANAGTPVEQRIEVLAPKEGWYVPTEDGLFVPSTLVPFETVTDKGDAKKRLEAKGIPKDQVSYFRRLDNYEGVERFVGRFFDPDGGDYGRFCVDFGGLPDYSGLGLVGCRFADEKRVVMEVSSPEEAKVKA
jgi:hypothetical protein